jgi:3-oxoacyl-[acyl-carrier protein] reductase
MVFDGKVVVVTGASAGIGRDIALAFAGKGATVVVNGRNPARVEAVAGEIRDTGRRALGVAANVAQKDQVSGLIGRTIDQFGRIDILVNNAGGSSGSRRVEDLSEEDWDTVVDNNLKSVFLVSQAALPHLKRQGSGRIINISSQAGRAQTILAGPHYAAAKAGVIAFTRQLARELAESGITVNAVAPGIINSGPRLDSLWTSFSPEDRERFLADIPLRRRGENREVVAAVLFLASDDASYFVGSTLDVNGGRWMI